MRKAAVALATAGTLGIATVAAPAPADARGWFGPAVIGGLAAGALFGALVSPAYAWGPYGYPYGYGGYAGAGFYPGYYQPYSAVTVGYAPAYYGYRYRRVFRPAYAYYGGPWIHRRWHHRHHRWHHHW